MLPFTKLDLYFTGKGGKNRRRGKNENETEKRELVFREDGQGIISLLVFVFFIITVVPV